MVIRFAQKINTETLIKVQSGFFYDGESRFYLGNSAYTKGPLNQRKTKPKIYILTLLKKKSKKGG
ncbi:MAG TPA: hypothetical protein DCS93_43860 [Microscillaceae bacterium]|nr:hypothetical protein [Microscillaceae bacterium]